jgi:hypothetical protein
MASKVSWFWRGGVFALGERAERQGGFMSGRFWGKSTIPEVLLAALAFGLILGGCPTENGESDTGLDGGAGNAPVPSKLVAYEVTADGKYGTENSEFLTFSFTKPVHLLPGDVSITDYSGRVIPTALEEQDSGSVWKQRITVDRPGAILVKIEQAGIEKTVKPVQTHKIGLFPSPGVSNKTRAGLYLDNANTPVSLTQGETFNLDSALAKIGDQDTPSASNYTIVLEGDETISLQNFSSYDPSTELAGPEYCNIGIDSSNNRFAVNKTITLMGVQDKEITITLTAQNKKLFTVGNGGSLVLGAGITLNGPDVNDDSLVAVEQGGKFKMQAGSKITGNPRAAVLVESTGAFSMAGGEITGNAQAVTVIGGGTFTMTGGTISVNTVEYGVYVGTDSTFIMTGGEITGKTANQVKGVYVYKRGRFVMTGGTITGNTGYGVHLKDNSLFQMSGGCISENTADEGGAVYAEVNSTFEMSGGYIANNARDGTDASAVRIVDSVFTMTSGTIEGNQGKAGVLCQNSAFAMKGGVILANAGPGVSIMEESEFTMSGGYIFGNKDSGVHLNGENTKFALIGGTISGNTGTGGDAGTRRGGGVFAESRSSFAMTGGEISGNTADEGGGAYLNDSTFIMAGGVIADNAAGASGGGAYVGFESLFKMIGGVISGNTAREPGYGGGVFVGSGTFLKSEGLIYGYPGITGPAENRDDPRGDDERDYHYNFNSNRVITGKQELTSGRGHAVYVSPDKIIDETVGVNRALDSAKNGGW